MGLSAQSGVANRLLAAMAPEDFARLAPHLECVKIGRGEVLAQPDSPLPYAYFPERGVGSIVAVSPEGLEVEAGLFGWDGMAPMAVALDAPTTPNRIVMQVADDAWRIPAPLLTQAMDASPALRRLLSRYAQTLLVQTSYTALSNAKHSVDQRLARWLLMCDDRVDGRDIAITHEFLALMLAVRRPSVTTSLHVLEGMGLLRCERGSIVIRDRGGLERFAGDAYGRPEAVYRDLLGPMRPAVPGGS